MKTILCYGDSNTYGLMPDLKNRYPRNVRWTGLLQNSLGEDYYVIEEGLGGRTTVWDDPVEMHKNGKKYLLPCMESHSPIDLIVLLLGTNDLKDRFHVSSFTIGQSIENLVKCIRASQFGPGFSAPKLLLVCPVPVRDVGNVDLNRMLPDAVSKSLELDRYYSDVASRYGVYYLNPDNRVETSDLDGIHYTEEGHRVMAELIRRAVLEIFA